MFMKLSVIIPTYNRGTSILKTLEALRNQTLPPTSYDVIIVDDASSDDTGQIVPDYIAQCSLAKWQYLRHGENEGRSAALNTGIRATSSPLVAFTDDDIIPCRDWTIAHVTRHQREARPVTVVGTVSYPEDWIATSNLVRYHNSRYLGHNKHTPCAGAEIIMPCFNGGNSSIQRAVLQDVGMYDERLRRGQDGELGLRLHKRGVRTVYEPRAAVIHYAEAARSYRNFIKAFQKYYTESAPYVIREHHDAYYKYDHWFVEPPELFREPFIRSLKKLFYRSVARPQFGRWLASVLEAHDSNPRFYWPSIFRYMLLSAAIEGVNMRPRGTAAAT